MRRLRRCRLESWLPHPHATFLNVDRAKWPTRGSAWPARYSDHILRCAIAGHEPVVTVLLRDPESRRHEQQLELGREIDMAGEIGHEALGQRPLVEAVVDQPYVGALLVRLVGGSGASKQPCLFSSPSARSVDV